MQHRLAHSLQSRQFTMLLTVYGTFPQKTSTHRAVAYVECARGGYSHGGTDEWVDNTGAPVTESVMYCGVGEL